MNAITGPGRAGPPARLPGAAWLDGLAAAWPGGWVLVIGHRATHYALDHLLNGRPLADAVGAAFEWQPGWRYVIPPHDACR